MASKNHSEASVLSRHPVHGVSEFADTTARNAHTYTALDIGKVVQTGTGAARRYWLIYDVVAGVASFKEVGVEVAFAAPSTLVVGGSNTQGVSTSSARADHVHALPAFGTTAGTFAQGDDARFNGVGGIQMWHADAPPLSPHAADDEFTGASLDPKWLLWDPGGIVSAYGVDTTRKMMTISFGGQNATRAAAVYQTSPTPDTEWTVYAKVALLMDEWGGSDHRAYAALFVAGTTLGSGTVDARGIGLEHTWGSPVGLHAASSSWTSYQVNSAFTRRDYVSHCYFRIRHKPTAPGAILSFDTSADGVSWQRVTAATSAIGLGHYGIMVGQFGNATGKVNKALAKFFRVFSGSGASGFDATSIGRYL